MLRLGAINDELSARLDRALDIAAELGIQELEIHTLGGKSIEEVGIETIQNLKNALLDRQLRVCNISSTVFLRCHLDERVEEITWRSPFRSIQGSYADHLRYLARSLEIAQELDAPSVRIFGFWKETELTEDIYLRAAERLTKPLQMAQAAGILLLLENCPHTYFDWGQRAIRLVEMVNSPWLRMLWDPCTGLRCGESDVLGSYEQIKSRLAHVHAKDIRFDQSNKRGHVYVPVGQGEMDWKAILEHLAADRYPGVICIETHHLAPDGSKESAARATYNGLRSLIEQVAPVS